jgi:hypothetical protein
VANVLCAWHKKFFPAEPTPVLGQCDTGGDSHGICARCKPLFEADMTEWLNERPAQLLSRGTIEQIIRGNDD